MSEEYNPATNMWDVKANMPTARKYSAAGAVNEKIYVIVGADRYGDPMRTNEEYDPATDIWTAKANMPTARGDLAAAAVNGKIYALGGGNGYNSYGTNEEYNPVTNKWAKKNDLNNYRQSFAAVTMNSRIYAIGGWYQHWDSGYSFLTMTTEEYNPATNTWSEKGNIRTGRWSLAATGVNGKIYAIGGLNLNGIPVRTAEEYSPGILFYIHKQN